VEWGGVDSNAQFEICYAAIKTEVENNQKEVSACCLTHRM
jgi:hypothetical protein